MKPIESSNPAAPPMSIFEHPLPGALEDVLRNRPMLACGVNMVRIRAQILGLINQAMENPQNHTQVSYVGSGNWKKGETIPMESRTDTLHSELSLGIDFISTKKGREGLTGLIAAPDLGKLVSIGRKIRNESVIAPRDRILEKNSQHGFSGVPVSGLVLRAMTMLGNLDEAIAKKLELFIAIPFVPYDFDSKKDSKTHEALRSKLYDAHVNTYADAKALEQGLLQFERILELRDLVGLTEKDIREGLSPGSGVAQLLSGTDIGFLEIAVFCEAFAKRHRVKKTGVLSLSPQHAKLFLKGVTRRKDGGRTLLSGEVEAYREACLEAFPGHETEGRLLLDHYLKFLEEYLQRETSRSNDQILLYFPLAELPDNIERLTDEVDHTTSSETLEECHPVTEGIAELIAMPRGQLVGIIQKSPQIICWGDILLQRHDAETWAKLINRLAEATSGTGPRLSALLFLSLLSLQPDIFKENPTMDELFDVRHRLKRSALTKEHFMYKVNRKLSPKARFALNQTPWPEEYPLLEEMSLEWNLEGKQDRFREWHPGYHPGRQLETVDISDTKSFLEANEGCLGEAVDYLCQNKRVTAGEILQIFDWYTEESKEAGMLTEIMNNIPELKLAMKEYMEIFIATLGSPCIIIDHEGVETFVAIDLPYELLRTNELNRDPIVPAAWKKARKLLEALPPHHLKQLYQGLETERSSYLSDNMRKDIEIAFPEGTKISWCHMLTLEENLTEDDLPILKGIMTRSDGDLIKVLAPKVAASSDEMKEQVLAILSDENAADLAVEILEMSPERSKDRLPAWLERSFNRSQEMKDIFEELADTIELWK